MNATISACHEKNLRAEYNGYMEFLWALYLTVCDPVRCVTQEVQRYENGPMPGFDSSTMEYVTAKEKCEIMKKLYIQIPQDGDWTSVVWECRPLGSLSS